MLVLSFLLDHLFNDGLPVHVPQFGYFSAMASTTSLLLWALLLLAVYGVGLACYRIIFHPLSKIPGPKLAAVTQLYQTFYCYYNGESRFYKQVEYLHNLYGETVELNHHQRCQATLI